MSHVNDPWAGIPLVAQEGKLSARRTDAAHPHDLFWALDSRGHRLLLYRTAALVVERKLPSLRGVSVEVSVDSLVLRLQNESDLEMFTTLCLRIVERTRVVRRGTDALDCILDYLERWQRFLGRPASSLLNEEEVRGLFCELTFLECELFPRFGSDAIDSWHGPEGEPQDFAVGTTLFEVKSHLAGAAPLVAVSSADQLWHSAGVLFLVVYTIGISSWRSEGARSLLEIVESIREKTTSPRSLEIFEERLAAIGYTDHPDYGLKYLVATGPDWFKVVGGFPRVVRDELALGICRLRYCIELAACLPFRSMPDWEGLGGDGGA